MFADNHKISGRQTFRLLTFDLLGAGTLLLPTVLAKTAGRDGIFCIALGVAAALLYLGLLAPLVRDMGEAFPLYLERKLGKACGRVCTAGYVLYFVLLAGYVAYLFADVVIKSLLGEESFWLVLVVLLLLTGYGVWGGIEGRARAYELLFWFLAVPLFAMFVFATDEVQADYWAPVFTQGADRIALGGYCVFVFLGLISLLLFLGGYVEKRAALLRAGKGAVLFCGGVYAALYLILLGIFGAGALGEMEFPAITMMSTVQTYGGFLKRTDAFMFGIWFFSLYALLNGSVFYGGYCLTYLLGLGSGKGARERERKISIGVLPAVLILALVFYQSASALRWFELFLWYAGTPFLVAVPLLLRFASLFKGQKTAKRAAVMLALVLLSGTVCGGCGAAELEDRSFPAELAVKEAANVSEAWLAAEYTDNSRPDYNHLKVLFLERALLENEAQMRELLDLLEQKNDVPRNTYVVAVEDANRIMELSETLGESVGTYLEKQFETVSEIDKRMYPTLGMFYQEQENRQETLFIPFAEEADGKPKVQAYCVWKRGTPAGMISPEEAKVSFFMQNKLKSYLLSVGDHVIVELGGGRSRVTFDEKNGQRQVSVQICCSGNIVSQKGETSEEELTEALTAYVNETAEQLRKEQGIDLANSYRKLGGAERGWYFAYRSAPETYEASVEIVCDLQIDWKKF